jgi:small-conductance mechanosensitive channel
MTFSLPCPRASQLRREHREAQRKLSETRENPESSGERVPPSLDMPEIEPGTGYTITTLTSFILVLIGLVVFLGAIGLQWAKLQWLVAALGVGLGFGLQEIVANFGSGIILLFERPIRVGDTVTIDGVTGTVSRILREAGIEIPFPQRDIHVRSITDT